MNCLHGTVSNNCQSRTLGDFVRELADEATACNQKLLVLRNYQRLPDVNSAKDIDIMIPGNGIEVWRNILNATCKRLGLSRRTEWVLIISNREVVTGLADSELLLDMDPRLNWRGVDWISAEECIKRSCLFKENIWIPHPADECVISFCMSYLGGGFVKEKYLALMSEKARNNKDEVIRLMAYIFGAKRANKIVMSLMEKDVREISLKATEYRIIALIRGFVRHPLTFIYTFCLGYYLEFRNKLFGGKATLK